MKKVIGVVSLVCFLMGGVVEATPKRGPTKAKGSDQQPDRREPSSVIAQSPGSTATALPAVDWYSQPVKEIPISAELKKLIDASMDEEDKARQNVVTEELGEFEALHRVFGQLPVLKEEVAGRFELNGQERIAFMDCVLRMVEEQKALECNALCKAFNALRVDEKQDTPLSGRSSQNTPDAPRSPRLQGSQPVIPGALGSGRSPERQRTLFPTSERRRLQEGTLPPAHRSPVQPSLAIDEVRNGTENEESEDDDKTVKEWELDDCVELDRYAEYVQYQTGKPPLFNVDIFNQLLGEQRFGAMMRLLYAYVYTNGQDRTSCNFDSVKKWVFYNAEKGHVPLLYFAAWIHLKLQPFNVNDGLLCMVKALARTAQDSYLCLERLQNIYEYLLKEFFINPSVFQSCAYKVGFNAPLLCNHDAFGFTGFQNIFEDVCTWYVNLDIEGNDDEKNFVSPKWCFAVLEPTASTFWSMQFGDVLEQQRKLLENRKNIAEKRSLVLKRIIAKIADSKVLTWQAFFALTVHQLVDSSI